MSLSIVILVWALTTLAGSGLVLSLYLTVIFLSVRSRKNAGCLDGSCLAVMQTTYARSLGFPNLFLAIPYYGGLVAFVGLRMAGTAEWSVGLAAAASALGLAMSGWLTFVLLVRLKQPCALCMIGHLINLAIALDLWLMWWL
jgi:uncharacterized membrane protein